MRKRILASLLTLVMILSLTPMTALAAGNDDTASRKGTQDDPWVISAEGEANNVTAYLTDNSEIEATYGDTIDLSVAPSTTYTLTISGTGAMADYGYADSDLPWGCLRGQNNVNTSITKLVVNEGVTHIGEWAFWKCTALTEVSLPDSLTSIGDSAFESAENLTGTFALKNVTNVNGRAFKNCGISSFTVAGSNSAYKVSDGILYSADGTTLICCPHGKTGAISDAYFNAVNTVGDYAFYKSQLSGTVTIPSGVSEIGEYAFQDSTSLTGVTISSTSGIVSEGAFRGCSGLTSIAIGNGITSVGKSAFENCTAATTLTLGSSIETIGDNAFKGNSNISGNLVIPDSVTTIGASAFENCTGLNGTLTLSKNLTSIGEKAFQHTGFTGTLVIPYGVTELPASVFYRNNASSSNTFTCIVYPTTLTSINATAFAYNFITQGLYPSTMTDSLLNTNWKPHAAQYTLASGEALNIEKGSTFSMMTVTPGKVSGTSSADAEYGASNITYESSDASVATVDTSGTITAVGNAGDTATITTLHSGTPFAKVEITVAAESVNATMIDSEVTLVPEETPDEVSEAIVPAEDFAEVPEDVTSEPALDDVTNGETANTEPASAPEQPAEEPEDAVPEETPEVTVPEEENVTEEPTEDSINSVEEVPADDTVTIQSALLFNDPGDDEPTTYHFYVGENKLGSTTGTSLQYNTTEKGLAIGENTVEVYAEEKTDESNPVGTIKVTLNQKALTVSGLNADNRTANGSTSVTLSGGSLNGVESDDKVGFIATGAMSDAAAGNNKHVDVTVTLTGSDAKWYTVTAPNAVTVNITSSSGSHSSGGSSGSTTYTVNVESAKNGSVKSDRTSASKGTTVTLTVTPKDGYELDELTVTDKNGKSVKVTEGKNGKYTFTMPASKVTVEASFAKVEEQSGVTFTDVPTSAYYYDAVEWAVENGITNGTSATTFSPDQACTRAQAVTFLWRAAGSPAPRTTGNPFTDISASAYYYDAVLWAVENGITAGTSATTFGPDATCTRGQIVTFLYRADGTAAAGGNPFTDVADSAYYVDAVKWAVAEGVTAGTSATTFSPNDACTRAQIVTFIFRAEA